MIPRTRMIIEECIERGASYGYHRAFKHVESPSEFQITEAISRAIMDEIDTYFSFSEDHV